MDAPTLNEELFEFCDNLLSKYKVLNNKSFDLKKENEMMFSKLDLVLKEKVEVSSERDSLKSQLDLILKENEILKSKNDLDVVLEKNNILSSNLEFALKENDSSKNKIILISKELECISLEKDSLKNDFAYYVCHDDIASSSCVKNVVSHAMFGLHFGPMC